MKADVKNFGSWPSMKAYLNDYRPRRGRYVRRLHQQIYAAMKPRKGTYKPTRN